MLEQGKGGKEHPRSFEIQGLRRKLEEEEVVKEKRAQKRQGQREKIWKCELLN